MKVALARKHVHRHCCVTIEIIRIWKDKNRLTSLQLCFASFPCGYPRPHIFLKPFNIRGSIQKELSCQKNNTEKADLVREAKLTMNLRFLISNSREGNCCLGSIMMTLSSHLRGKTTIPVLGQARFLSSAAVSRENAFFSSSFFFLSLSSKGLYVIYG